MNKVKEVLKNIKSDSNGNFFILSLWFAASIRNAI